VTAQWWRSWHGAPTDPKWLSVMKRVVTQCNARNAGGVSLRVSDIVAVWYALCDHASQQSDRGNVENFDAESVGDFLGIGEAGVRCILRALHDKGLVNDHHITNWEKRQPKREDNSTERVRRMRSRDATVTKNETQRNATKRNVTQRNARVDKDKRYKTSTTTTTTTARARKPVAASETAASADRTAGPPTGPPTGPPSLPPPSLPPEMPADRSALIRARQDVVVSFPDVASAVPVGDDGRDVLAEVLVAVPSPRSYMAAINDVLPGGMAPNKNAVRSPPAIRAALVEWLANAERPNLRRFRGYLADAREPWQRADGADARAAPASPSPYKTDMHLSAAHGRRGRGARFPTPAERTFANAVELFKLDGDGDGGRDKDNGNDGDGGAT
jgi:hypothetical protein